MYEKILKKYQPDKDNLIYILHDIQDNDSQNYVSEEAVNEVSNYLNISQSHIYGVLTFYSMFSVKPRGKHIIRLCDSPPCFLKGSNKLYKKLSNILKIKNGQTTKDGKFTLELVACLGVCGNAPVAMINNEIYADLTEDKIEVIINKLNKGENNVS
jgi:NADH-quinone oxidoreductase E subunit